jgi:phosphatidate cytidylyltransferase
MKRLLTAVVALPILIVSIIFPSLWWLFLTLAALAIAAGLYEFYVLVGKLKIKAEASAGFLAATAIFTVSVINEPLFNLLGIQITLIVLTAGVLIKVTLRGAPFDKMIVTTAVTVLSVLYLPFLGSHLVLIRTGLPPTLSMHVLAFFFLVLMGGDAGAYYVGRTFGKHKLAPKISPGKTWEGVAGGIAVALGMAVLSHYWFFPELPLKWALPLAAVMTVVGILGDLTESALKRGVGAKDAANILPGHGGILDRLDSLLFNAPLIYYFARFYFNT